MNRNNREPLVQPILSREPEIGHHKKDVLDLSDFLRLLKEEEDYFAPDQENTLTMITRLRKIFYDQWGWNKELIRGAAPIVPRYEVKIVYHPEQYQVSSIDAKKLSRYKENQYEPKYRLVTYRADDRIYGNRKTGQVPEIYRKDHQELRLPDGYCCDIAHVLAGLDAANHPQVVSPLPAWLSFLDKFFPHVDSNKDIVTWLGDIASSGADFLFSYLRNAKQPPTRAEQQRYIDLDAPPSDMLGNIDAFVIAKSYSIGAVSGRRVTDILSDYYYPDANGEKYRHQRFRLFANSIGLAHWNGKSFDNEKKWLSYYAKQLRDNTSFQVYSYNENGLGSLVVPLRIWLGGYRNILNLEQLLQIFLKTLTALIEKEYNNHSHEHQ